MGTKSTVEYEWYIPERVYIIRIKGIITVSMMGESLRHVLGMLNEPGRLNKVHLIYDIEHVQLEASVPLSYILSVTAEIYRHSNTASMVSVIGLNRLHEFLANSAGKAYTRETQQGQAVGTLNEAFRFVASIDPSLSTLNL